jgi:hypothetical protein
MAHPKQDTLDGFVERHRIHTSAFMRRNPLSVVSTLVLLSIRMSGQAAPSCRGRSVVLPEQRPYSVYIATWSISRQYFCNVFSYFLLSHRSCEIFELKDVSWLEGINLMMEWEKVHAVS